MASDKLGQMSSPHIGPSNDASYQISDHLGNQFQKGTDFRNILIRKKQLPVAAMFVN